jgi:hypothetical protein
MFGLFKDAAIGSDYMASMIGLINSVLEIMWNEAVVT